MKRLAGVVAAVLVVAGCSASRPPAAPVSDPPTSEWTALGNGGPVLGIDLYALSNYPPAEVEAYGIRTLGYIKDVLKADAVGIVWNFFVPSDHSNSVETTSSTLSAANVGILTKIAAKDHLLVEYRPVVLVPSEQNSWSGEIVPDDFSRWLDSYYQAELPYLKMAQQLHVSEFVAATEMHKLNSSRLWPAFFSRVSRIYRGVTSYAAWDDDYFPPYGHVLPLKYVGMDMYWHMGNLQSNATSQQVTSAFEVLFGEMPAPVLHATAIDETGIPARAGAYANPGQLGLPGRLSPQVQANWFTAACETVHRYHMRGVFFWKVDLTDNPAHPASSLSTFEGRLGAAAISKCAQILR